MITPIKMPKLGETMETGKLIGWKKREGDKIKKDDVLLEVSTDKATFEVEALQSGILRKIIVPDKTDNVPVLSVIGYLADKMDEPLPKIETPSEVPVPIPVSAPVKESAPVPVMPIKTETPEKKSGKNKRVRISPLARKLANDRGVDITSLRGSGPMGRIVKHDVINAAGQSGGLVKKVVINIPAGIEAKDIALSPMRKTIAQRLTKSKSEIPHYYLLTAVDMTSVMIKRTALMNDFPTVKITVSDFITKAVALSIRCYPLMNSAWQGDKIIQYGNINIGFAVALPDGLIVPVIPNADNKSISELAQERVAAVTRAKAMKVTPAEMSSGTFTITNLGMYGIESFSAIINPPQVGILAVGAIKDKLVVDNGAMIIRKMMKLNLSADHRVIDGAYGAEFINQVKTILEHFEEW
ncbi:MAG: dihydrolipoamide acetyltransferase family protein [Elusimicrobiota bacterium]